MELNTSQPQHSQIVSKPSRNPILYIFVGLVVVIIAVLALLIWQQKQQIASVASELTDTKKLNEDLAKARRDLESRVVQEDAPSKTGDDNAKVVSLAESYQKAAGITTYDFKVETVEASFARVSFKTPFVEQCFYKKVDDTWTQIFCGVTKPSNAVIKQYSIPPTLTAY